MTPARARALYLAQGGFAAASAEFLTGFRSYSATAADPAPVRQPGPEASDRAPTAQDVTGAPARTFAAWAREHARSLRE